VIKGHLYPVLTPHTLTPPRNMVQGRTRHAAEDVLRVLRVTLELASITLRALEDARER